ncbi:MAG: hypothetical protein ACFE9X_13855 [Promethearchaeota archaeon]
MTILFSLFEDSWTTPIPEDTAVEICHQIQKYHKEKNIIYSNCLCHFCERNIFKDGKNNRGCSLINHQYDKFHQNLL